MGKAAKEHRKKIAKRNAKIQQKKSAMQKAFDTLLKAQMDQVLNKENTKIELSGKTMEFEILEDRIVDDVVQLQLNPEESAKINKEFKEQPTEEEQQ
jgi:hypothetical protein